MENSGLGLVIGEELLDEGDATEVIIPHTNVAAADVIRIAVTVGETGAFVERGLNIGGAEPVAAAGGGSEGREDLDIADPSAATVVLAEEPIVLLVVGIITIDGSIGSEG